MKTLLQLNTSLFSAHGQSTRLNDEFVAAWKAANPQGQVVVRDFTKDPVPHLTAERFQAFLAKPDERTAAQSAVVAFSDALIAELRRADVVVIGMPMYNFAIPTMLQSYFDHIARAGVTFRYTENGPQGLLTGKKAYVFSSRGGVHAGSPRDTQTGHVRDFLNLVGISDVEFIYAEGLNMGEASKQAGLDKARAQIARLKEPRAANQPFDAAVAVARAA